MYRVHVPKTGKGLRKRIDDNTWSRDTRDAASFPAQGVVQDSEGNRTLTKLAKPVPRDSSGLAGVSAQPREDMREYAEILAGRLPGAGPTMGQAAKIMKRTAGFTDALKASRQTFGQFAKAYPALLSVYDGRVRSTRQQTL